MDPIETLTRTFRALANENRLRLLGLLARREHSVQELAELLELKEPTVSHHLALLRESGLVRQRQDGNTHWYALEAETLRRLARDSFGPERVSALAGDIASESWETRVLRSFVSADGRLEQIPASRKKRRVVLDWLARQFDEGREYPEAQVNEILQQRHWDSATLRRELIGYRMLARAGGRYRRLPEVEWKAA